MPGLRLGRRVPLVAAVCTVVAAAVTVTVVMVGGGDQRHATSKGLNSTQPQTLDVHTGSPSTLIYGRLPRRALDMSPAGPIDYDEQIIARDRSGREQVLGTLTQPRFDWSLVGSLLTADRGGGEPMHSVDWWNLSSQDKGHLELPPTHSYLAAAPGGVLAKRPDGSVELVMLSGERTPLGRPFVDGIVNTAAADDHGAILGGARGEVAYLPFTKPYRFRSLQSDTTMPLQCLAVTATYAGCLGGTIDDHVELTRSVLIPLDGDAPTGVDARPTLGAAVSSDSLIWLDSGQTSGVQIATLRNGSDGASKDDARLLRLTGAYGAAVGLSADRHTLVSIDRAGRTSTLLSAPTAPVTYASLAIGNGRVITIDDLEEPRHPDSELSVHAWPLTDAGTRDSTQRPQLIGTGTHREPVIAAMLAACGRTIVYATGNRSADGPLVATLHVVRPSGTAVIDNALRGGLLQCSGSRVLYCRPSLSPELPRGGIQAELRLHDLDTGADRLVANVFEARADRGSDLADGTTHVAALLGDAVAYVDTAGHVVREDLATGAKSTITRVRLDGYPRTANVYLAGRRLLLHVRTYRHQQPHDRQIVYTVGHAHPTLILPRHSIGVSLTPDGVITETEAPLQPEVAGSVQTRSFSLRAWDGRSLPILAEGVYLSNPLIEGNTLAWIDENDALQTRGFTSPSS